MVQASDFRIEWGQIVFLCCMQNFMLGSLKHQFASTLNAHSQTDWAIEDQAENWTQQPVPMMSEYSAHLTSLPIGFLTWLWRYMFVVVIFDALAQANDFRIEIRQVVFLCWMQDSKLGSIRHQFVSTPDVHSQTDWAIEDQAKNLNSTAHPYDEWAFSPLDSTADLFSHPALEIYVCCCYFGDKLPAFRLRIPKKMIGKWLGKNYGEWLMVSISSSSPASSIFWSLLTILVKSLSLMPPWFIRLTQRKLRGQLRYTHF